MLPSPRESEALHALAFCRQQLEHALQQLNVEAVLRSEQQQTVATQKNMIDTLTKALESVTERS